MKKYALMILQFGVFAVMFAMIFHVFDYYGDHDDLISNFEFAMAGAAFVGIGLLIDIINGLNEKRKSKK